jgi:hypothetical protein
MLQTLRGEGTSRDQIMWVMVEQMGKQAAEEKQGRKPWTLREFGGQTVWDWLHLLSALAIPVVLAIVGLWFTAQQDARQQQTENQRAEAEQELAVQRAQDEALQAYLDQMSTLMLEKDLRNSEADSEVRTLAQARTLTILERVNPDRKAEVMQFLVEASLIQSVGGKSPIIGLRGADLHNTDLRPSGAERSDTSPLDIAPGLAEFDGHRVLLTGINLYGADLAGANLGGASLLGTNLSDATLLYTDLRRAYLRSADLSNADLSGADLTNAQVTEAQLREAKSLEGATMPNGQKYEDWLKDRESRKEDGQNGGSP